MTCEMETTNDCIHIEYLKELIEAKLDAITVSHSKFEVYLNAKLEQMNEIRGQLGTQKADFITRIEFEAKQQVLIGKIENLQKFMWALGGALVILEVILRFVR